MIVSSGTEGKLVRDLVPFAIQASGRTARVRTVTGFVLVAALHAKLSEESAELLEAETRADRLEELADLLEVVRGLASAHGLRWEEVERAASDKRDALGAFERGTWLEAVEGAMGQPGGPG